SLEPGRLAWRLMVIRRFTGGGAAGSRRRGSFVVVPAVALLGAAMLPAQEAGAQPPVAQPPVAQPPAAEAAQPPDEASQLEAGREQLGGIVADEVRLRCWPETGATPPVIDDVLAKDNVVVIGRSENGFRQVVAPLGRVGYVSRKFAEADADG